MTANHFELYVLETLRGPPVSRVVDLPDEKGSGTSAGQRKATCESSTFPNPSHASLQRDPSLLQQVSCGATSSEMLVQKKLSPKSRVDIWPALGRRLSDKDG